MNLKTVKKNLFDEGMAISPNVSKIKKGRRGRPRKKASLPLDLTFNSEIWDSAKTATNSHGYIFRYVWDPNTQRLYTKFEHVLAWERAHQRSVPPNFCIHHCDFNPANNSVDNLHCLPVIYHLELHAMLRKSHEIEVTSRRIINQYVVQAEYYAEIWSLVRSEIGGYL